VLTEQISSEINSDGRVCRLCQRRKNWDEFHKKENGINGRHSQCAKCTRKAKVKARQKSKIAKTISVNVVDVSTCNYFETFVADSKSVSDIDRLIRGLVYDTIFELEGDEV
jgi:hypothetical protein